MPKFLATIIIESDDNTTIFTSETHEELCVKLFEERVLDTVEYNVTHLFDLQEIPAD